MRNENLAVEGYVRHRSDSKQQRKATICRHRTTLVQTSCIADSIRQSITIPGDLIRDIRRSAKLRHETISATLIHYVRTGIAEEQKAKKKLASVVEKIRAAPTPEDVKRYTDELAEALFGPQAPLG